MEGFQSKRVGSISSFQVRESVASQNSGKKEKAFQKHKPHEDEHGNKKGKKTVNGKETKLK